MTTENPQAQQFAETLITDACRRILDGHPGEGAAMAIEAGAIQLQARGVSERDVLHAVLAVALRRFPAVEGSAVTAAWLRSLADAIDAASVVRRERH